jgi:hypothetical protein
MVTNFTYLKKEKIRRETRKSGKKGEGGVREGGKREAI